MREADPAASWPSTTGHTCRAVNITANEKLLHLCGGTTMPDSDSASPHVIVVDHPFVFLDHVHWWDHARSYPTMNSWGRPP